MVFVFEAFAFVDCIAMFGKKFVALLCFVMLGGNFVAWWWLAPLREKKFCRWLAPLRGSLCGGLVLLGFAVRGFVAFG